MDNWIEAELTALRATWSDVEYILANHHWVLLSDFVIPSGWDKNKIDLAVRLPANLPGEAPYGFWVRNGLSLASGGGVTNYKCPSDSLPFIGNNVWGQFSWAFETWIPPSSPGRPSVMVPFVQSISRRLGERN